MVVYYDEDNFSIKLYRDCVKGELVDLTEVIPIDELLEVWQKHKADTPQTDYPCNTCANKGDHDGECQNCVADSAFIRWKTPSHYKPKQTDCPWK